METKEAIGKRRRFFLGAAVVLTFGLTCLGRGDAAEEIARLAKLMDWKAGSVVADIGAGDGNYSFAAASHVGALGKVFATEIDEEKLKKLRAEVHQRKLQNVAVVESKEADTNLPTECCDAIFLRWVYHHLTKPGEFDANLVRSLKPGGRLAVIDFPPRAGLEDVKGVPSNRGGHGIPQSVLIQEITAAGLQVERIVSDWPEDSYCVVFLKK